MSERRDFLDGFRGALRAIATDKAARSALIGAAVLYSLFYPVPYRREVASRLPVIAADLDRSPASRSLLRRALAVRAVRLHQGVTSVREAEARVIAGDADAALIILPDFQKDILRGGQGRVAIFGGGASLGSGGPATAGLADAVASFGREAIIMQARISGPPPPPPLELVRRPLFNTREGYGSAIVPAVAVLIVHQTLILGVGLLIGTRRERGDVMSAPPRRLLGIGAAFGAIGVINLLYYSGFVFWMEGYPRGGNFGALLVSALVFIAATIALALWLGSFFAKRETALQVVALTSLTLFFLANISWPAAASPTGLTWVAKLLPSTAGINAMVKASQVGANVREVSPELANLALLALLYGGLAVWRYRPRTEPASA